jgi:hypothetical protein
MVSDERPTRVDLDTRIAQDALIRDALIRHLEEECAVKIEYMTGTDDLFGWHVWHWRGNDAPRIRAIPCADLGEAIAVALTKAAENAQKPRSTWGDGVTFIEEAAGVRSLPPTGVIVADLLRALSDEVAKKRQGGAE